MTTRGYSCVIVAGTVVVLTVAVKAQVDQQRAAVYFKEAAVLCEREGGTLWGVSLCGPMVIADTVTHTIATNQPAPAAPRPAALGFANAAMDWGGTRWSTFMWPMLAVEMAADEHARGRVMLHELFHRIQPQLGLLGNDGQNEHLDTLEGRYWLQLEWRALAKALGVSGLTRTHGVEDALAFRMERRSLFPGAAENERRLEINEGLAQYTGTVASVTSSAEAVSDAIDQLTKAPLNNPTLVRTFPYPTGAAYGILLDVWSPGWTRQIKSTDDIGQMLMASARIRPAADAVSAAMQYGGPELRMSETKRDADQRARVSELRRRFVDGPVLVMPNGRTNAFVTNWMTPIPGVGTVYPSFHTTADWGSLDAERVLLAADRSTLTVPAPSSVEASVLTGDGWTLRIAAGWIVRPGQRPGDFELVQRDFPHAAGRGECQ